MSVIRTIEILFSSHVKFLWITNVMLKRLSSLAKLISYPQDRPLKLDHGGPNPRSNANQLNEGVMALVRVLQYLVSPILKVRPSPVRALVNTKVAAALA